MAKILGFCILDEYTNGEDSVTSFIIKWFWSLIIWETF
jgi:hypothetical protein